MRKVRMALAVIILAASLTLLAWGLWPTAHERRVLSVSPTEMTLPTPSSFELSPGIASLAGDWQP
jgi:hypothetical protein